MWKRQFLPLNESIWVLTFHRLFEFSDYIAPITTFFFFFSSHSWARDVVTKLDIIWVHTLSFGFSYLESMSNAGAWKLGWKKTVAPRPELHTLKQWHFFLQLVWAYELFFSSKRLRSSINTRVSWCPFFLFWCFCPQLRLKSVEIKVWQLYVFVIFQHFSGNVGGGGLHGSPSLLCYTTCMDNPFFNRL